jgi:UDP-N-acetylmuramoyl-tripeptide--D-alanyl-D-alanine ligase
MNIIRGLIYILQSEFYDPRRFLSFVYRDLRWWALEKRQAIVWTAKAKILYWSVLSLALAIIFSFIYFFHFWAIVWILLFIFILPLFIIIVLFLLWPLDYYLKQRIIFRAGQALRGMSVKVIGITGSYGKTSLKEILAVVLGSSSKVVSAPDNVNTDLGVANFILTHSSELKMADFFIVEMGAYQIGDIARISDLVKPAYSLLTGINESHLERFGDITNTIKAKFELAERTAKKVIVNLTDQNVRDNYSKFKLPAASGVDYSMVSEITPRPDFAGWSFKYGQHNFSCPLLARHNIILIAMALVLAEELGLDLSRVVVPLAAMPYIKHRLEPIRNTQSNLLVIDDSYNGNFQGFVSGLEVLDQARGRKLVITPGLVELGAKKEERHREIARLYAAKKLDQVLLVDNSATRYIVEEFKKIGFVNYKVYPDTVSAHQDLGRILKAGDTIIFQNDWPDNYK